LSPKTATEAGAALSPFVECLLALPFKLIPRVS